MNFKPNFNIFTLFNLDISLGMCSPNRGFCTLICTQKYHGGKSVSIFVIHFLKRYFLGLMKYKLGPKYKNYNMLPSISL